MITRSTRNTLFSGMSLLFLLLLIPSCSSKFEDEFSLDVPDNGKLYVGAAKMDISPVLYSEDGSCPEGRFCFETQINIGSPQEGCTETPIKICRDGCNNDDSQFEGILDVPAGDPESCQEPFIDSNKNGYFDAMWLAGFDSARSATGIDEDSPVSARVLVLAKGEENLVLIIMDFVGFPTVQLAGMRERIAGRSGGTLSKENLIVGTTHNHEAPDLQGIWGPKVTNINAELSEMILTFGGEDELVIPYSGFNVQYWAYIEDKVMEAVKEAAGRLEPAKLKVGEMEAAPSDEYPGTCLDPEVHLKGATAEGVYTYSIDCNNDEIFNESEDLDIFEHGISWDQPRYLMTDSRFPHVRDFLVYTLEFVKEKQPEETIATFINWTNHIEAMGGDNTLISADYPGYMCNLIESKRGGICVFQVGTEGGLLTPLGGHLSQYVFVPKLDEEGNYLDEGGGIIEDFLENFLSGPKTTKPAACAIRMDGKERERAMGLGRHIARVAMKSLEESPVMEVKKLEVRHDFIFLPLENPTLYIGGILDIMKGLSPLIEVENPEDVAEIVYQEQLPTGDKSCGPFGCFKIPLNLIVLELSNGDGKGSRVEIATNPGEFVTDYVVGRPKSTMYFYGNKNKPGNPEYLQKLGTVGEDPNFPDIYTKNINPQVYEGIKGLREIAKENGADYFIMLNVCNSSLGYMLPRSDFLQVNEGVLDDIKLYSPVVDPIVDEYGGLCKIFDLPLEYKDLKFSELLDMAEEKYPEVLQNLNASDGSNVYIMDHPDIYEETVALGPKTGDIVYNGICDLVLSNMVGKCDHYRIYVPQDPNRNLNVLIYK
ncbi:MAG: hypothetical protein JSU92_05885 [Deltaproteobacteria bacterium]|nr:MAG: hypothetical protein JSU92_05885 [Deltaproteobacteria bacterium]